MGTLNYLLNQPWVYLVNTALAAAMGWYAWRRPHRPDTLYFQWITIVWVAYEGTALLLVLSPPGHIRYGLWVLLSFFTLFLIPMELLVALDYTGSEKWFPRHSLFLLFLPAFFIVVIAFLRPEMLGKTVFENRLPNAYRTQLLEMDIFFLCPDNVFNPGRSALYLPDAYIRLLGANPAADPPARSASTA